VLTSISLALNQTLASLHRIYIYIGLLHHVVYLLTFQLMLLFTAPAHKGMARLSWPGWLVTHHVKLSIRTLQTECC